jgi:hypothetical protein
MPTRAAICVVTLLPFCLADAATGARADCITLKNGGEIRGELLSDSKSAARAPAVAIRTLTGATVSIVRDEVAAVIRRRPVFEAYVTRRRAAADTVAGQWELAEWCRQNALSKERLIHLQRVLELDPDHVAAHRGLGHIRQKGRWMTPDERIVSRGLVRHKGKHLLPQELDLLRQSERVSDAEKSWLRQVRQWQGWLAGERADRKATALAKLNAIRDPRAVPALARVFRDDPEEELRLAYVAVLSNIEGDQPVRHLAAQSIIDESQAVREAAIGNVRRKGAAKAMPVYLSALRNPLNLFVNRAGAALGQVGDETTIPPLIDALVTRHSYRAILPAEDAQSPHDEMDEPAPVVLGPSVELALRGARMPAVVPTAEAPVVASEGDEVQVEKEEENPGVLAGLSLLAGKNFGYDIDAWRDWYRSRQNAAGRKQP